MTLYFSNSDIQVYRMRRIGSTARYSVSATYTVYRATIEPALPDRTEFLGGIPGHTYTGFVDADVEVRENDEIRIVDTGKIYHVKGVNYWAGAGLLDHRELTLVAKDGDS